MAEVDGIYYDVSTEQVIKSANDTINTAENVQSELATLRTYLDGVGQFWTGQAHDQFQVLMESFRHNADVLHHALTDIGTGLQGTAHNYVDGETAVTSNLQKIEIPLAKLD